LRPPPTRQGAIAFDPDLPRLVVESRKHTLLLKTSTPTSEGIDASLAADVPLASLSFTTPLITISSPCSTP
ncbi:MAG: hypothetical protein ACPIOQ_05925, partial [Promethearchaeia archaeon]